MIKSLREHRPPPSSSFTGAARILQKSPGFNPEHHQNLIICSLAHYQHFLKVSLESVHNFWSYLANKQTNKQTNAGRNAVMNHSSAAELFLSVVSPQHFHIVRSNSDLQLNHFPVTDHWIYSNLVCEAARPLLLQTVRNGQILDGSQWPTNTSSSWNNRTGRWPFLKLHIFLLHSTSVLNMWLMLKHLLNIVKWLQLCLQHVFGFGQKSLVGLG